MKLFPTLLVAALLLALPSSCKSNDTSRIPCTCGTAIGDMEGCEHPLCREGKQNPDNPNCVCGTLEIPKGEKK